MIGIIVGIDDLPSQWAFQVIEQFKDRVYAFKIHASLVRDGAQLIRILKTAGAKRVMVDRNVVDIPKIAAEEIKLWADFGADIITVFAAGGLEMMAAARKASEDIQIWASTVLTSQTDNEVEFNHRRPAREVVYNFACLAKIAGLDGIVSSAQDAADVVKDPSLNSIKISIPGIRAANEPARDQNRITSIAEAVEIGAANIIVASRIALAPDPLAAFEALEQEIHAAQKEKTAATS